MEINFFSFKKKQKILSQDALKHILTFETRNIIATQESLEGALRVSQKKGLKIVTHLVERDLIGIQSNGLVLTEKGRQEAIQLIRAHRLWECHLYNDLGVPLAEIHDRAEAKEHILTAKDVDRLEADLGFPKIDPHGDKIPSRNFEWQSAQTVTLLDWPVGELAIVVHLEDEPQKIFNQILAEGLQLESFILVKENSSQGIHIWVDGRDCWIAPILAVNIFLKKAPLWLDVDKVRSLSAITTQQPMQIVAVRIHGYSRRRLMDLGFISGAAVKLDMQSMFGEPKAYRIRDTLIALRKEETDQILVQPYDNKEVNA